MTRTGIQQAADDLQGALYDEALRQCDERNPHAVAMIVNEANRLRRNINTITRITTKGQF